LRETIQIHRRVGFRLFRESISMKLERRSPPRPVLVGNARRRFQPERKELWLKCLVIEGWKAFW